MLWDLLILVSAYILHFYPKQRGKGQHFVPKEFINILILGIDPDTSGNDLINYFFIGFILVCMYV